MGILQRWKAFREYEKRETLQDVLLQAGLLEIDTITASQALNIPAVSGCIEFIANTVATIPIKLYKETDGKVEEVKEDKRMSLLNDDTKDTLDAFQFKRALVSDYLLEGAGYAYINKERNNAKSIHYIEHRNIAVNMNADPIFKSFDILCNGKTYRPFEFIKLIKNSKDGATGYGIIKEHSNMLTVVYNTLIYENMLVSTGGNKKGFLKSQGKLTEEAMTSLKTAWNNLYKTNTESVVILNNGLEFQEASSTSVEMQLNENKRTNSADICKLFNIPVSILEGKATEEEYNNAIKMAVLPILKALETALNRDLLLESEKGSFYFACDTKELLKGDVLKRYQAYEIAARNSIMQVDEIRYMEDLEPLGLEFIKLGLQDVLYNPKTKEIYTPNTDKSTNIEKPTPKGGENIEN